MSQKKTQTLEEKRAYSRAYQAKLRANRTPEQKEEVRAYQRAYRAQRKEREDKVLEKFQQNNDIDEVREIMARREKKAKANRANVARWQRENKTKHNAKQIRWSKKHPDYHPNYLETLDLTDETISDKKRLQAWGVQVRKRDENKCYYHSSECSSLIDAHHIIPKEWKSKSSLHNFAAMKFSLDNGMCLCRKHHIAVHKEMKLWMRE